MVNTGTESLSREPLPLSLGPVLKEELGEIVKVRRKRDPNRQDYGVLRDAGAAPEQPVAGTARASKPEWQVHWGEDWLPVIAEAHRCNLTGLAFSGGGIRSAAFNLGVLQALAELKLLFRFDYLSTVSGGGYIGSWLAAWIKRLGSFAEVQKRLAPNRVHQEEDNEPPQIRFLRVFSNYLTPKLGLSGDTFAAAAIILRNILLNQLVLLAVLFTLLLLPRVALGWLTDVPTSGNHEVLFGSLLVVLFSIAFAVIMYNVLCLDAPVEGRWRFLTMQKSILCLVAVPLLADAIIAALWRASASPTSATLIGAVAYFFLLAIIVVLLRLCVFLGQRVQTVWQRLRKGTNRPAESRRNPNQCRTEKKEHSNTDLASLLVGSLAGGGLAGYLYATLSQWANANEWSVEADLTFGVPLVLAIFLLAATLQIGVMGINSRDALREWWGRLGGWLLLLGIVWLTLFTLALYFPRFVCHLPPWAKGWLQKYLTPAWVLSTAAGLFAAKGGDTSGEGELNWKDWLAKAAPYIFVVGLFCLLSWGIDQTLGGPDSLYRALVASIALALLAVVMAWRVDINEFSMHRMYRNRLVRCFLGASNFARPSHPFTGFDDVDEMPTESAARTVESRAFQDSAKSFKKDERQKSRLPGRFTGFDTIGHETSESANVPASQPVHDVDRSPNLFIGFDENDDMLLKDLRAESNYDGPYPVLNASLNLVKGQDLAWQERKAASFVMSPLYCGYDVWLEEQDSPITRQKRPLKPAEIQKCAAEEQASTVITYLRRLERFGYRPTEAFGGGLSLGTAMGISGAAASPNMGFYTSTPVAFLMTVFNVRLGQWLGNPRHKRTWKRATPGLGLTYLLNELFAGTTDEAAYVYLSDGGHFDNMGLYELVKRRCGLIVVCDAEADGNYEHCGLANAIRKCGIDMGIRIDLDVSAITPQKEGEPSKKHCAIGTIHYECADMEAPSGTIIYFKASLTGDEPTDVQNYSKLHRAFPHDSTIDQWFSESQFESYRKLGYHEVTSSLQVPQQQPTPGWLATAAATFSRMFCGTGSGAPLEKHEKKVESEPLPLEEQLHHVFEKFGFDTSKLRSTIPRNESYSGCH